jgi:signal transduction histidine kinase
VPRFLEFSRQRLELLYSLSLIILIPACVAASTIWLTSAVKADFDQELRRKANLANEVFGVSVASILQANSAQQAGAKLQTLIDQTRSAAPEILQLGVSAPAGVSFTTVASSDPNRTDLPDTTIQTQLAWSKTQPVASLISSGEGDRAWLVATPVLGPNGAPVAVTNMRVSLQASDQLIGATLRNASIALAVILAVIVALLLHHFRFVQYAELFRKQRELAQMKDDFISVATHELKAPMSIIKGYISMSLEEEVSDGVRKMLNIAFAQTNRLTHLISDLLDVSRLEQGRAKFQIAQLNLPDTIQPMMAIFEVKAKDKGLKLAYQPPGNLPLVKADPDRVAEILTNLIDNAIKYSKSGTVSVSHMVQQGSVATSVTDTGIGMTTQEQSRLFQRFYRAKNSDTAEIEGTGLGLWIIKQYAEKMGGSITVASEKGKGSSFTVTLPSA